MGCEVLHVFQPHVGLKEHSYLDKKHRSRAKATVVKDYGVQGASGRCSLSYGLVLGSPARSRELDSMILMGPFQLEIFYDSKSAVQTT